MEIAHFCVCARHAVLCWPRENWVPVVYKFYALAISFLFGFEKFSFSEPAGLANRCFDLLLFIVYSIHLETMVSEKMNDQRNCNIMRLLLQRRPIILIHKMRKTLY